MAYGCSDCLGVSAPLVAQDGFGVRSLSVAMPHNEQADANNMRVSAAAPRSVAAGVDAAASAQNGVPRSDQRVCIEAIMGGDGTVDSKGLCAEIGLLYGSAQAIAPHAMFSPIHLDAQLFDGAPASALKLRTYAVLGTRIYSRSSQVPACTVPQTPFTRKWDSVPRSEFVCEYVRGWLLLYKGVAVVVSRIGARAPSKKIVNMHCGTAAAVLATSESNGCLDGALVNGVLAKAG
eukprot:IDg23333t1